MTISENAESIEALEVRIHILEKIMDLLYPVWRYEDIEHISQLILEE